MSKIKYIIGLLLAGLLFAAPAYANGATVLQIQSLPGYINYTDFKLSCTTDGTGTATFYAKKDGGSYSQFATVNLSTDPCQAQVSNNQFGSEGLFWFKVEVGGLSSETATTMDTTPTSPVSEYGKSRIGGGTMYHITWKNPLDSDYTRVFIYRGTEPGFESHGNKIAEAGGSPGDTMSYDDGSLDPNKEYYYYLRAIDRANNASDLVGDTSTTTVYTTPTPGTSTGTSGAVTVLPKEQGTGGSVLGTEATPSSESGTGMEPAQGGVVNQINSFAGTQPGLLKWILTHKKISLGVLIVLGLVAWNFWRYNKKSY